MEQHDMWPIIVLTIYCHLSSLRTTDRSAGPRTPERAGYDSLVVKYLVRVSDNNPLLFVQSGGMLRGLSFPVASYGLINSVYFGVYGNTLKYLKTNSATDDVVRFSYREIMFAGFVGGLAQLVVACPVDVVKVVLQSQISRTTAGRNVVDTRSYRHSNDWRGTS